MSRNLNVGDVFITDDAPAAQEAAREAAVSAAAAAASALLTGQDVVTSSGNLALSQQAVLDAQAEAALAQAALDSAIIARDAAAASETRSGTSASDASIQAVEATRQVGLARAQVELAKAQVQIAQEAVATGRLQFNTLNELNTKLNFPEGTLAEVVNDGANNGSYRKSGASGSGFWALASNLTLAALLTRIEELESGMGVAVTYTTDLADVVVTDVASIILAGDEQRVGDISVKVPPDYEVGFNFTDNPAVFGQSTTWVQGAGDWVNHPSPGQKSVSAIARRVGGSGPVACTLSVRVFRKIDGPLPSKLADAVFSRWSDPVDARYKTVLRTEIDYLAGHGIYQKLAVWALPGSTKQNFRVNIAKPGEALFELHEGSLNNGLTFVPYVSIKGNGVDAYVDTMRLPGNNGVSLTDHFLAAKSVGGQTDGAGYLMGASGSLYINPNRGAGIYGFRSGPGTDTNSADPKALDLWAALSRVVDANNYKAFIDEAVVLTPARVLGALPTQTMKLLCGAGGNPASQFTSIPLAGAAFGSSLSDLNVARFVQSNKRIAAVCAQIVGT